MSVIVTNTKSVRKPIEQKPAKAEKKAENKKDKK